MTRAFWLDLLQRVAVAAVGAFAASILASQANGPLDLSVLQSAGIAGLMAGLIAVKGLIASQFGDPNSAALFSKKKPGKHRALAAGGVVPNTGTSSTYTVSVSTSFHPGEVVPTVTTALPPSKKLGKRHPSRRPALKFGDHLAAVPAHPIVDTLPSMAFGMDGNDSFGDCVAAGWDHFQVVVNTLLTGSAVPFTPAQILALYRTQNPNFDPNGSSSTNGPDSASDGGMDIQGMLEYAVKQGWCLGFAKVDHTNINAVECAAYLGLALITGETLSQDNMSSKLWDATNKPSIGGHCTVTASYDTSKLGVITWGASDYTMTPAFLSKRVDEVWFVITQAHVDNPKFRAGFDLASFGAAFQELTGKPFPAVIPIPAPPPVPVPAVGVVVDDPALVNKIDVLAADNKLSSHDYLAKRLRSLWKVT